jgi:hypothetical protein
MLEFDEFGTSGKTGWYRGFIRGTVAQLSLSRLDSIPVDQAENVMGSADRTKIIASLGSTPCTIHWRVVIFQK